MLICDKLKTCLPDVGHALEVLREEGGDAAGVEAPARRRHPLARALQVELGRAATTEERGHYHAVESDVASHGSEIGHLISDGLSTLFLP